MVAELWMRQFLALTSGFIMSCSWNKSCQTSSLGIQKPKSILPLTDSGMDDLESFQAWSEEIKKKMSLTNPLLYEVFGEIVSSKQPIEEGNIHETFQNIMEEKQISFRVPRVNFKEEAHQLQIDELRSKEADKLKTENERRQLGCLLIQRTQGETQLRVTRWLSATNGWEAWRQLNLSIHFKLLTNLMKTEFDDQPASCLQQFSVWKEKMVIHQQLSREQLRDTIKLSAAVNGLKGSVKSFVLLNLNGDSSFSDLDNLLALYVSMHDQRESSLDNSKDKVCRDKPEGETRKENTEGRGKGEAYPPQPTTQLGKGKPDQLPGGTPTSWTSSTDSNKLGSNQARNSKRLHKPRGADNSVLHPWVA